MVRNRVKKTDRGNFSEEAMREAVLLVENGMSLRKAAKEKGLNSSTLSRYVQKKKKAPNVDVSMKPNYDCRRIFSLKQEDELAEQILICSKMFYGLTMKNCRQLAYEMAMTRSIECPLTWHENQTAGLEWCRLFVKRHPGSCLLSRAKSFTEANVKIFFDDLENEMNRVPRFADGMRIYNLDEIVTTPTFSMPPKIVNEKNARQGNSNGSDGDTVTTCCIVSATGNTIPPVMIFPSNRFEVSMIKDAPSGTLGLATPTGWLTTELFIDVIEHFIRHSNSSKECPTVLMFDNHESHMSIRVLEMAKANGVTLLTFPPHSTRMLQPLEVGVFEPFRIYYTMEIDSWVLQHPGTTFSLYDVAGCVKVAHLKSMTPLNITSAFCKTGIFPYNRNVFSEEDFVCGPASESLLSTSEISNVPTMPKPGTSSDESEEQPSAATMVPELEFDNAEIGLARGRVNGNKESASKVFEHFKDSSFKASVEFRCHRGNESKNVSLKRVILADRKLKLKKRANRPSFMKPETVHDSPISTITASADGERDILKAICMSFDL